MNKLVFIQTGGPFGDATSNYKVSFPKEITVEEFINIVLEERSDEWGYFRSSWSSSGKIAEYSKGELLSTGFETYSKFKNRKIESVSANGGWSRMDYMITVV